MSKSTPLPTTVLNAPPDPQGSLWASFVAPFLAGSGPHLRCISAPSVTDIEAVVPLGTIVKSIRQPNGAAILAETTHAAALVQQWSTQGAVVWLRAATSEDLAKAVADVQARMPPPAARDHRVPVDFWLVGNGAYTPPRTIAAASWADALGNYPAPVRADLERLRDAEFDLDGSRIVLWHGPPGTGKTSAIRALARAWRERARMQVILDPELVFARSSTLMEVLVGDDEDEAWRLLVVEDADELLRADAKDRVGQALSRLLNLSDGILGQGIRVLVLITTNEPIGRLHPALIRPGRCLIETEFGRFGRAEAEAWFGEGLPAGSDFSLAELTALRRGEPVTSPAGRDRVHTGQYL
ncbi:MAG: DUF5925 domain-containing protein [Actinomycetota bacterium]